MFMTTHSVLVDAHFTSSSLSSLVSVSSLFACNIVGCLPMETLHIGTKLCIVFFGDITKASIV